MGLYPNSYATDGASVEYAVLSVLDLPASRAGPPGVDDVLREPFLPDDGSGGGVGQRTRPGTTYVVKCKATFRNFEAQRLDPAGDDPTTYLELTLYEDDLQAQGLLSGGVLRVKKDDLLLRLLESDGIQAPTSVVRVEFAFGGRTGLRCFEVKPGFTGERTYAARFESQAATETGLSGS